MKMKIEKIEKRMRSQRREDEEPREGRAPCKYVEQTAKKRRK